MVPLSVVAIVWSMVGAGVLMIGIVHLVRWSLDRQNPADLALALIAVAFAGVAGGELGSMHAQDPAAWGAWVRWMHVPLFGLFAGLLAFVHFYLGTGRRWLLWTILALRSAILLINFSGSQPNLNFAEITTLEPVRLFGETVMTVGESRTGRWQFLGLLSSLLLLAYVLDAAVRRWRQGDPDSRRGALLIGGSVALMILLAVVQTQLVIYGLARMPFLITAAFLPPLLAISLELGIDLLRASRLARELKASQLRLELAAASADLGLWEWDGQRGLLHATRQAREMFGLPEGEATDYRPWVEKIHADDVERILREVSRAMESGEEYATEFRVRSGSEQHRWVLARGRAVTAAPGRPALVRGVLRDVSERKLAEGERQALQRELAHAGRVAMLGQLSSSLTHELSQPLGAILRNAEAAEMLLESKTPDHEELKAIVTDILRDDRRARDVIDRMRSLLKHRDVERQAIDADMLLRDVLAIVGADAASRQVTLEHVPTPGLPMIAGDRVQISQVILNLVLNAMDAMNGLPAASRVVRLWSRATGDGRVELCVTDSGPGVPAEAARRIFEPFFTTKSSGLGIGLAISRKIAEAHGGSLTVDAGGGAGATFRLSLPAMESTTA